MKKVVFYGRYSSVNQTEQSIEGQLHVCEKFAAQNDLQIVRQYVDRALSGTSDNRPEFQQMIADSSSGAFEAVLIYKLDRFARNRYDSAIYKKKLRDNGVRVISATENITDTPEGIIMEGLLEAMDEYYSAELGRKMKRGKEESFHKGKFIGHRPPFGYRVVDHRLEIDEVTAPIAQEIFQRFADGERQNQILVDLNRRGILNPIGRKWNKVNISTMLANRIYIGKYTIKTMEGEMPCPALISQEVFAMAQQKKAESIHQARANKSDYDYILTGRMTCAQCGASVCGSCMQQKYHYYQCHKHCGFRLRADELHERVRTALHEYLTEDKLDELAGAAYAEYEKEEAPASERELLEQELADVKKKLGNAVNAVLSGYDSEELKNSIRQLEARKAELSDLLDTVSVPAPKLTQEHFRTALQLIIENAQSDDLHVLLDTVVNRIIVNDQKVVICINLTDENNIPPLEQIRFKVKCDSTNCPTWI